MLFKSTSALIIACCASDVFAFQHQAFYVRRPSCYSPVGCSRQGALQLGSATLPTLQNDESYPSTLPAKPKGVIFDMVRSEFICTSIVHHLCAILSLSVSVYHVFCQDGTLVREFIPK